MTEPKSDFETVLDTAKTKVEISEQLEIIRINGCTYTFSLFNALGVGGMKQNVPFVIRDRKDGCVTIAECTSLSPKRKMQIIDMISDGNNTQS